MKKLKFLCCILMVAVTLLGTTFFPLADENEVQENSKVRLMIESYEVANGEVLPGNEIEIKLVIHNTNDLSVAQNVVLSVVNNQGIAVPVEGKSNQILVGNITGGTSVEVTVPVRIIEQPKNEENISLLFYMTFADGRATEVTNEAYISIPMKKEYNAEILKLSLQDGCYVKEKAVLSSEIINNCALPIENAKMHIFQANGTETVYSLGNIGNGITKYFDHTIVMSSSGEQELTAFLSYQDEEGNEHITPEMKYPVRVLEDSSEKQELQSVEKRNVDREFLMTNAALVCVALVIIIVSHKRGTRRINSGKEVGDGKRN